MFPTDEDWVLLKNWKNQHPKDQLQAKWNGYFPNRVHSPWIGGNRRTQYPNLSGKPTTDFSAPSYTCEPLLLLSRSAVFNSSQPHRLYPPDSSVHGDSRGNTAIQECLAISFSRASFQIKNQTYLSCILRHFTTEPPFSSVQSLSHVRLFATPWIAAHQASLSITNSRRSHKLMSIESVMPSSNLILCRPLLLLPPIPPSIRVFSNDSNFAWGGQSTGVSASVLPMNTQEWPPLGWTGWISLQSKGLSRVFSNTTVQKDQFFGAQLSS